MQGEEKKGLELQIVANIEQIKTEFADFVSFESSQQYVYINFLQSFPNALPDAVVDGKPVPKPERMAKIVSRVGIPWDHFVRLIPAMIEHAGKTKDVAQEQFKKANDIFARMEQKC